VNAGRYDGIVLNGAAVSLGTHLSAPKFAILGGADLDVLAEPRTADLRKLAGTFGVLSGSIRYPVYARMIAQQRRGLRTCSGYNYFPSGIHKRGDQLLEDIFRGKHPYRLQIRGADVSQSEYAEPSDRRGSDVLILVPVRVLFREPLPAGATPNDKKGNDIIIRGIADFMRTSQCSPTVMLVEKGPDVAAAKELAASLGVAEKLIWFPEKPMIEILEWYRRADIVFDQLGEHVMGAVTLDAMLTGRPVLTNARPEIFDPIIPEPSPICHARTPEDVRRWLERLVHDPELRRDIGLRSSKFVRRHFSATRTAEAIAAHFESLKRTRSAF
jgi:glycosyltransferase involved in cell wall biosynthesis